MLSLFGGRGAFAENATEDEKKSKDLPNFKYNTVKTPEGLAFRVPEDMPIEKRGGILAPIPFDEYMYGKFKQLDERLNAIDAKTPSVVVNDVWLYDESL